ncbi:unnamed protein product [Didymodactylos carnosus]|uniref:Uncharacterized protein n=1 Tax=Didymodactylos carnosus TaxID=1234261 RepID=A0A8S2TEK5_9BILA|nr:unnamed protein product [Didymodactylos carnosus]CAF4283074.1 unnamed protein product [Didymodactylos carnosus]
MICKGCETIYSTSHFQQHRQQLAQQLDKIVHQHNLLQELLYPTSSSSMQENNIKQSDLLKIIEQWKYETIKRIEDAAELAQQQVTQLMNETTDKVKKDFRLVANEITHSQSEDNYVEQDLDSWTEQLNKLKQQLLTTTQTIELNIIPNNEIDWSSMIKIKKFSFNSLKIMKPSRIVNIVHGFGGIQLGASAKSFVHYAISQNALNQYNQNGHEKTIGWNFGRINDICYSHDLNQYVMITSNSVYAYNENNNRIEKKPIRSGSAPYMQYWSCTTTPQMLLISYDHWGSRIEQFEMSNYKMIKYWNVSENEYVGKIRYNSDKDQFGLIVQDRQNNHKFELRNKSMEILRSIQLDNSKWGKFLLVVPPLDGWLILYQNNTMVLVNVDCTTKQSIEYTDEVLKATFMKDYNCLVLSIKNNQHHYFSI